MRDFYFRDEISGTIDACDIKRDFAAGQEEYTGVLVVDCNLCDTTELSFRAYVDGDGNWEVTSANGNLLGSDPEDGLTAVFPTWHGELPSVSDIDFKSEVISSVKEYRAAVQDQINTLKSTPYDQKLPKDGANLLTKTQIFDARKDAINDLAMDWWLDDSPDFGGVIRLEGSKLQIGMDIDGNIGASVDGCKYREEMPNYGYGCTIATAKAFNAVGFDEAVSAIWDNMQPWERKEQVAEWAGEYGSRDEDGLTWDEALHDGKFDDDGCYGVGAWDHGWLDMASTDDITRFVDDGLYTNLDQIKSSLYNFSDPIEMAKMYGIDDMKDTSFKAYIKNEGGVVYDAGIKNGWRDPERNVYGDNRAYAPYEPAAYKPSEDSPIYSQNKEISR